MHFYSLIKKSRSLLFFLLLAFISQIFFGYKIYDSIVLSVGYSIGLFIFISIAYSIVYSQASTTIQTEKINHKRYQCFVIIGAILLNFFILSGQFSKDTFLFKLSKPIRHFFFESVGVLHFNPTITSIIVNNITAVILPLSLLLLVKARLSKNVFNKEHIRILTGLFLLYLPVIIFSGKSLYQVLSYLPVYLFLAAIPEEILYRGLLQTRLESVLQNPVNAIVLSSFIFGLMHLPINIKMYGNLMGFAGCIGNNAFGGLFIGYLYYKTRSIWVVILFHLISGVALS